MKCRMIMQFLLWFCCPACFAQYGFDTVTVYFPVNKAFLDSAAMRKLDSLSGIVIAEDRKILIYGYADYLGKESLSRQLSEQRAAAVRAYLLSRGIGATGILACDGVGQIKEHKTAAEGNPLNRRTDIFVKRLRTHDSRTPEKNNTGSIQVTRALTELDTGEVLVLKNINFYPSSHRPLPEARPALEELVNALRDNPTLSVRIEGHICCITETEDALDLETGAMNLSTARAEFIYRFLIRNGIDGKRLSYQGFGRRKPLIKKEQSEEDAKVNRRVEIRVLSK